MGSSSTASSPEATTGRLPFTKPASNVRIEGDDGAGTARLLYRFPKPTPDGRTDIVHSPLQLLERLVAFVPPPRMHRHRFHGVLAPHAGLRSAVVAIARPPAQTDSEPVCPAPTSPDDSPRPASSTRIRWTVLLARIYEVLPLLCPGTARSVVAAAPWRSSPFSPTRPSSPPPSYDPEPVPDHASRGALQFDQWLPDDSVD